MPGICKYIYSEVNFDYSGYQLPSLEKCNTNQLRKQCCRDTEAMKYLLFTGSDFVLAASYVNKTTAAQRSIVELKDKSVYIGGHSHFHINF